MTYRLRNILIAVGLAAFAGLLTLFYVTSYKNRVDKGKQNVTVIVAKTDIPAGTLGSAIVSGHMLGTAQVTRNSLVRGIVTNPNQIKNEIAIQPIYQGEQVTTQRFGPATEAGIRTLLKGTQRAIQLKGDANQLLAGTLHAGDHVDVVASIKIPTEASQYHVARDVVRDLLVLRTSGAASSSAKIVDPNGGSWVMLRATDTQAQKVYFVYANDDWSLALRPSLNDADSPNSIDDATSIATAGVSSGYSSLARLVRKAGR